MRTFDSNIFQVWIYPCFLGNRKVFALLKCEKIRFDATYLWSFWKVDGSYTKDIFLTSARKQSADDTGTTLPSTNAEYAPNPHSPDGRIWLTHH